MRAETHDDRRDKARHSRTSQIPRGLFQPIQVSLLGCPTEHVLARPIREIDPETSVDLHVDQPGREDGLIEIDCATGLQFMFPPLCQAVVRVKGGQRPAARVRGDFVVLVVSDVNDLPRVFVDPDRGGRCGETAVFRVDEVGVG